jgi:hypothetical protein
MAKPAQRSLFGKFIDALKVDSTRVEGPSLIRSYAPDRPTPKRIKAPLSTVQFAGTGTKAIERGMARQSRQKKP